jgi:hypothetical protein
MSAYAPLLADLALFALVLGVALGVTLALLSLFARRAAFAARVALATLAFVGVYALALVGAAFASREQTLAPGAEKSVAGFDPHLHIAVVAPAAREGGAVWLTLRLRSDARRAVQDPRGLEVRLVDARGRAWPALASDDGAARDARPFRGRLAPGESSLVRLRFEPAPDARGLRLLVLECGWPDVLSIGHESSPFHRHVVQSVDGL